jgi:UDP-N-acetylglucosamine 1-carboxyvinyltransferase
MGVDIKKGEKNYTVNITERKSTKVILREMSVTATENVMMLAAGMPGKTILRVAATEPHVVDLGRFLIKMGARIKGLGTHNLEITGTENLHGAKHKVISDANEAATFLIMGVATKSPIVVKNTHEDHLDLVLEKLREFGADFKIEKNSIEVVPNENIKPVEKIDARTYPGIPTDIQAPLGVLATQANGDTYIFDTIFEGRFGYIDELVKMGANAEVLNRREVIIHGSTKLTGKEITSFDLRAGVSLIIAALLAEGKSTISEIYQVDRGYEKIEKRLKKLGADIKRVKGKAENVELPVASQPVNSGPFANK